MGDYNDFYGDGRNIDPNTLHRLGGNRKPPPKGRSSVSFTMTKAQRAQYKLLGGSAWLKKFLDAEIKKQAQLDLVGDQNDEREPDE